MKTFSCSSSKFVSATFLAHPILSRPISWRFCKILNPMPTVKLFFFFAFFSSHGSMLRTKKDGTSCRHESKVIQTKLSSVLRGMLRSSRRATCKDFVEENRFALSKLLRWMWFMHRALVSFHPERASLARAQQRFPSTPQFI